VRLCLTGSQTESENIPELEFRCTPPMPVKRFRYLCVVADLRLMGSVDFQHSERLYNYL